ncbi:hypothetical protein G4B88_008289 [Cannabis sativa]|uniref:PGG domain-containing protein n=1 Tax=Cannabis sativa TaxID=3483 RepID=A0A7J6FLJ7_CANSA|nr:hypothetical protein G4B88_008289 [Cannabis sativa]
MSSLLLDDNDEMYSTKKDLFNYVMKGKWDKVVELYNDKPIAHKAKITKSGDTALHLAISEHQESVVEDLVKRIREKKTEDVLRIQNEIGCTPLHFAVSMGSVRMCKCILEADESLVEVQNNKGETPLFWSVLYGQKKVFLCIDYYCQCRCRRQNTDNCDDEVTNKLKYAYCRRTSDGETILQCAIIGEYFVRVLVRRLSRFKFGVAEVRGRSLVFEFPSTFAFGVKSGSRSRLRSGSRSRIRVLARDPGIYVDHEWKIEEYDDKTDESAPSEKTNDSNVNYPQNNQVCVNFFELFKKAIHIVTYLGSCKKGECLKCDLEKDTLQYHHKSAVDRFCPLNNIICFEFGKLAYKTFLVVVGLVEKILQHFPVAIHDTNKDKKNIFLLAVENRRLNVLKFLAQEEEIYTRKLLFRKVDKDWNCALHLASIRNPRPWPIPGDALQMQWELNWYKYVETFMPSNFYLRTNMKNQTPQEVFTKNHKMLVKSGGQWLTSTATACSVIAVLIATVAFATSTVIPGGTKESNGKPKLENYFAFDMFAILSLVALCFSITALVMFLSILTSRYEENDFAKDLPTKLFLGLTSLFVSIASIIGSFCAAHFFVLEDNLSKHAVYPVYAVTCLPITIFAFVQFPLYVDLIHATFRNVFE